MFRHLAFRYVHKYVGNLEDVIEVRLDSSAPFLDLVLVACDLKKGLEFCYSRLFQGTDHTSKRFPPFFRRTIETLVSLAKSMTVVNI